MPNKLAEIERMMILSTAHITLDTNNMLVRASNPSFCSGLTVYLKRDYGFFVYVPDEEQMRKEETNIPEDLLRCINFARANGCGWLCLDCDGNEAEELETYEW